MKTAPKYDPEHGRCPYCTHPWDDHDLSADPPICQKPRPSD